MTVSYCYKVNNAHLMTFVRLFFRWKGSVWKAVYVELIIWLAMYFALNLTYRNCMNSDQRQWWTMWENIGWIDTLTFICSVSLYVTSYIASNDERSRMFRRNIIRYMLFFQVLVFRDVSTSIRNRFPTLETFVVAGYLTSKELDDYQNTPTTYKNYYTPVRWAMNLIRQARQENEICSDLAMKELFDKIIDFRKQMSTLLEHDFQPIPLIYTVVVCLSVRLYFIAALFSRQIIYDESKIDTYIPVITIVEFIFYMGWMKVAEALLNPFGDDDDDFECNWLLDRNFEVGYIIADQNQDQVLVKDKHWNTQCPEPLYSLSSLKTEVNPLIGSAVRRGSMQVQSRASISGLNQNDVIMVARTPVNANEDSLSVTGNTDHAVLVRSSADDVFNNGNGTLSTMKRKLSRFTGLHSPPSGKSEDAEAASGSIKEDDYIFMRVNSSRKRTRGSEDVSRFPHASSTIHEEDDEKEEEEHDSGRINHAMEEEDTTSGSDSNKKSNNSRRKSVNGKENVFFSD